MTVSTVIEMRLRHRPPSTAPIQAAERATGIQLPSDDVRRKLSWGAHVPFGIALGLARPLLGDHPLLSPLAFLVVASLPDMAVVPALTGASPPWKWGAKELAISAVHHVAYAAGAEATWRAAR